MADKKQITDEKGNLYILAQGKATKQFESVFVRSCRQGAFTIFKKEGLQRLYTSDCEK
ncbi:MAG: hypothetical protein Q4A60_06770 [Pasteurellaceae bacterium]|nr:hypothetical protein [Pasteurellaceae bacterium]